MTNCIDFEKKEIPRECRFKNRKNERKKSRHFYSRTKAGDCTGPIIPGGSDHGMVPRSRSRPISLTENSRDYNFREWFVLFWYKIEQEKLALQNGTPRWAQASTDGLRSPTHRISRPQLKPLSSSVVWIRPYPRIYFEIEQFYFWKFSFFSNNEVEPPSLIWNSQKWFRCWQWADVEYGQSKKRGHKKYEVSKILLDNEPFHNENFNFFIIWCFMLKF